MMANNIDKVVRRTYRYFYDDGLVEMAEGYYHRMAGKVDVQGTDRPELVNVQWLPDGDV